MRLALLFSGQGQQTWEHLLHLRQMADGAMAGVLEQALGETWHAAQENAADLSVNVIAQPLIFGFEMAWWRSLQMHLPTPICAAGYSLGEMAACAAAGLFVDTIGVNLCHERARLMDRSTSVPTAMLSVLGLNEDRVFALAKRHGYAIAIRNSPSHFIVTGPAVGQDELTKDFEMAGASRLTTLAVQTPSHTSFLAPATIHFADKIASFKQERLAFPVISAVSGKLSFSAVAAADALARQISSMLHWDDALETMIEMQPDVVLEIGPGNALSRMLGDVAPGIPVRAVNDFRSPEGVLNWLGRYA